MKKKVIAFIIILISIILVLSNVYAKSYVLGDTNNDNTYDQIDLSNLIRHVVGLRRYQISDTAKADLNEDGTLDQRDISVGIKYIITGTQPKTINDDIVIERVEDQYTYDQLKQMMQNEIAKKDFPDIANQFLMEIFEELYANYPSYQGVYKDFPNTATFVNRNLISVVKDINSINMFLSGTDEANEIAKKGGGYTVIATRDIYLIYGSANTDYSHKNDLEKLFHEIIHVKQVKTSDFSGFDYQGILVEGGATFNSQFMSPYNQRSGEGGVNIRYTDGDNTKSVFYFKQSPAGNTYATYLHAYQMLEYALGYDLMDYFENGNVESSYLREKFYEKTGIKLNELNTRCEKLYKGGLSESERNTIYTYMNNAEKAYLQMIINDISNLNTSDKDSIKKYINIYRDYKQRVMPIYYTGFQSKEADNLNYQELNLLEADNLLINKILSSNVMVKFSNDSNLNKMAIRAIIRADRFRYYKNDKIYQSLHLPSTLDGLEYSYFEDGGNGHLILKYGGVNNYEVCMEYTFNGSEIISIEEASNELRASLNDFKSIYK